VREAKFGAHQQRIAVLRIEAQGLVQISKRGIGLFVGLMCPRTGDIERGLIGSQTNRFIQTAYGRVRLTSRQVRLA